MTLVVDHREAWFQGGEEVEVRSLPLGDFAIEIDGRVAVLIERKTACDLWASIRDGRHADQLRRLIAAREEGVRVMYIVEGFDAAADKAVRTACTNLALRDGIPVLMSGGADETRDLVFDLAARATQSPEWFASSSPHGTSAATSAALRKPRDALGILRSVLCVMPHVSVGTADAILATIGASSLAGLVEAVRAGVLDRVRVGGRRMSRRARDAVEQMCKI